MIQCYQCEDWFHNQHLTPPLLENVEDKFFLLCKACITTKNFLPTLPLYEAYFHKDTRDHLCKNPEDTQVLKRHKPNNSTSERIPIRIDCKQQLSKLEGNEEASFAAFDMLIDESFLEILCQCERCKVTYAKLEKHIHAEKQLSEEDKRLRNNLEGNVNEDEEEKK